MEDGDIPEMLQVRQIPNDSAGKSYPGNGIYARRIQRRNAPFVVAYKFLQDHHESILYFGFALCLTFGSYLDRPSSHAFYFSDALRGKLMLTSWTNVSDFSALWDFLEYEFTDFIYSNYFPGSDNATILGYNYILNGIQLRQLRVRPQVCTGPAWIGSLVPWRTTPLLCYPGYTKETEDKSSFSSAGGGSNFSWSENGDWSLTWSGELGSYGSDGFVLDLPRVNLSDAKSLVASFRSRGWLDLQSRAIFIDTTLFNPVSALLLRMRLLVEVSEFGGLVKTEDFTAYQYQKYVGDNGSAALMFDIFFLLIELYYLGTEFISLFQMKAHYCLLRPAGILHVVVGFFVFAIISIRAESKNQIESQNFNTVAADNSMATFANLQNLPYLVQQDDNLVAVLFILIYGRLFLHAVDVPGVSHLLTTIKRCIVELIPLLSLVVVNFVGFGTAFFLIFGLKVPEYRSLGKSFVSNALFLLGDSGLYSQMYQANRDMAPFLCGIFIISEAILLFNLFVAILVHGYSITKAELDKEPIVLLTEVIESAVKLLSTSSPEQVLPIPSQRSGSELVTSKMSLQSGKTDSDPRLGSSLDLSNNMTSSSRPQRREGSQLAFSAQQAVNSVSKPKPVAEGFDGIVIQEGLLEITQRVGALDDVRTQLMAVSEKLNALTDFFLSQPGNKMEQNVELINRKLDHLAEALIATQYRVPDGPAAGPSDAVENRSFTTVKPVLAARDALGGSSHGSGVLRHSLRTSGLGRASSRVPGWIE